VVLGIEGVMHTDQTGDLARTSERSGRFAIKGREAGYFCETPQLVRTGGCWEASPNDKLQAPR
jgi:hypothetical protein